jgi:hypothetical protein
LEERRSYRSFATSAALHGALLALILLGFASAPRFADSPEAIPIETVSVSELNQIANGEKDAKPAPQSAPAPPAPPPDLRPSARPTPPPTPPAKAEPASPPKPAPPPKAEATPPPLPQPMPPERPEPPPPQPKAAVQEATVQPPARPKTVDAPPERPKEPPPEKPKPSRNFDPNSIAKLIGQGKTPTAQTAAATPQGLPHHDAPHMSMSMASALDAWLTESYLNCWTPPPTMPDGETYVAEIRVIFNPDGSLSGRPVLLNPPADRAWRAHAESAMRAVHKCDPLKVPPEYMPYFEQWKIETIHFDPRETQG